MSQQLLSMIVVFCAPMSTKVLVYSIRLNSIRMYAELHFLEPNKLHMHERQHCDTGNTVTPKKQGFYCRFNSMDCIKKTLNKRERLPLIDLIQAYMYTRQTS